MESRVLGGRADVGTILDFPTGIGLLRGGRRKKLFYDGSTPPKAEAPVKAYPVAAPLALPAAKKRRFLFFAARVVFPARRRERRVLGVFIKIKLRLSARRARSLPIVRLPLKARGLLGRGGAMVMGDRPRRRLFRKGVGWRLGLGTDFRKIF